MNAPGQGEENSRNRTQVFHTLPSPMRFDSAATRRREILARSGGDLGLGSGKKTEEVVKISWRIASESLDGTNTRRIYVEQRPINNVS